MSGFKPRERRSLGVLPTEPPTSYWNEINQIITLKCSCTILYQFEIALNQIYDVFSVMVSYQNTENVN